MDDPKDFLEWLERTPMPDDKQVELLLERYNQMFRDAPNQQLRDLRALLDLAKDSRACVLPVEVIDGMLALRDIEK